MDYQHILWELHGSGVGVMTLNRPETLNALSQRMLHEMLDVFDTIERDDAVRVLVITGTGRAFCSGADLTSEREDMFEALGRKDRRRFTASPIGAFAVMPLALAHCRIPVLAAVNGIAAGGGLSVSLGSDIRVASTAARFSSIFIKRALNPDTGTSFYLPRLVETGRALEMMWTGDFVEAEEALRIGLVSHVVEPDQLMPFTMDLAERIASGPSVTIEMTKKLVKDSLRNTIETQLGYEAWASSVAGGTDDRKEGLRSFAEKRAPVFRGR